MRRTAFVWLLLFATLTSATPPPGASPQGDYNIVVHVTSSYYVPYNGNVEQWLDVVIDGKKFKLSDSANGYVLAPGDYKARLIRDDHKTPYESYRMYEFLFPDKKTRKFHLVGQSE